MKTKRILLLVLLFSGLISARGSGELDSLNRLLFGYQNDTVKIKARLRLARIIQADDKTAAFIHIQEALDLSHQIDNEEYLGASYKGLGVYHFRNGNYKSALENLFLAEEYFDQAELPIERSSVLNWTGLVYIEIRNYFDALSKLSEAEEILVEHNDTIKVSSVHNNLGVVYHQLEYYDLAAKYYLRSFDMALKMKDEGFAARIMNNLGEIALQTGDHLKAKNCFLEAIEMQQRLGNAEILGLDYANLGMAYLKLGEVDSAKAFLDEALVIARYYDDVSSVLYAKCGISAYYTRTGNHDKGIQIAFNCLEEARERGDLVMERMALENLFKGHQAIGEFEKALDFNLAAQSIRDSVLRGGDLFGMSQLESNFNSHEQAARNEELWKNAEAQKEEAFFEKEWFLLLMFFILLGGLITGLESRRWKRGKEKMGHSKNVDYLSSTRVLYLLAVILYSILPVVVPRLNVDAYDPLSTRMVISGFIFIAYLLTYWFAWARRNLDRMTKILYVILVVHTFYLLYVNKISIDHIFYLIIIMSAVSVVFKKMSNVAIFAAFVIGISLLISLAVSNPELNHSTFISIVVSMLIVALVVAFTRLDLDKHLDFTTEAVNQADAIVFIVNRKGDNIYTSRSIKGILGYDPRYFANHHDWIQRLGIEKKTAARIKHNLILIAIGTIEPSFNPYQRWVTKSGVVKWFSVKEKRIDKDRVLVIGLDVTDQKKIQDELAISERNFRQISETLSDVFYLKNIQEGKCEYVSPNSEEIMGVPPSYFYDADNYAEDFVVEEDKAKVLEALKGVTVGVPFDIEYRIVVRNNVRWIREKSYPVKDVDGTIVKNSGLCQDITERKKAEEEIRKLSLIASNTDNFILMVNQENRVEWANQSFYNLTGYSEKETIGKLPLELISGPLTSEKLIDEISEAVFERNKRMRCELINYRKDETIFHSALEITPLMGPGGQLEKYFVIGSDISGRIADREQIEELSIVASNTSNYVIIAGANSNSNAGIKWVNESFTEKFGYTFEEVEGKLPSSFMHQKETQGTIVKKINETVFEQKKKFSGEIAHLTKSGNEIFANVNITPIVSEDGTVEKYFVLGVDITERKKNQEALELANKELLVKERALNESEQNFRELIKSIKEVFWLADYETDKMIFVSDSYRNVFGRSPQSLTDNPKSWRETLHPKDREWVIERVEKHSKSGGFNEEFRLLLDSGEEKWINSSIFLIYDNENKPVKMSGFVEDITDKKLQELRIKKIVDQLDVVHTIEKTILNAESTTDIIYNTLESTLNKLPVLRVSLALFDVSNGTFFSYAKMKNDSSSTMDGKRFDLKDFSLYDHLNKTRTNYVEDITKKEFKSLTDEILIEEGAKLTMLSPLIYKDELIGSLNVCFTDDNQEDTGHYIEITNEVANGLALAIYQSQLKEEIQGYNDSITASIDYAKMIQQAYIPTSIEIDGFFRDAMIVNRPKDIVSGDFYWVGQNGSKKIVVVGDCTGHGVPGAFMTIIGISELNTIVSQKGIVDPAAILNALNKGIVEALASDKDVQLKDGMDVGIFCYDAETHKASYAGARRPLYHFSNGELSYINGARLSIGDVGDNFGISFETSEITLNEGDKFYIFSDGCTDQFGGESYRKFGRRRLDKLILSVADKDFAKQAKIIDQTLRDWKGTDFQTDDILFVGFSV